MATKKPIGTAEASEMLGVLPQTVVRLIRDGEIPGFKVRDVWRVYREDVEAYIQRQMEKARQSDKHEEK
jgi:excisionase family DNA binding protein